jgi:hypothetical protein
MELDVKYQGKRVTTDDLKFIKQLKLWHHQIFQQAFHYVKYRPMMELLLFSPVVQTKSWKF